jgi:hypothetical protein
MAVPILAMLAMAGLSGCADISQKFAATASQMPGIGLSPDAPERPAAPAAYPAVHDMPAARTDVMLTDIEQQRLADDLAVARDRQQALVGLPPAGAKKNAKNDTKKKATPAPPQPVVPVSSGQSIY